MNNILLNLNPAMTVSIGHFIANSYDFGCCNFFIIDASPKTMSKSIQQEQINNTHI